MRNTPNYNWRCHACDIVNLADTNLCSACGCPAVVSVVEAAKYNPVSVTPIIPLVENRWIDRAVGTRIGKLLIVPLCVGGLLAKFAYSIRFTILGLVIFVVSFLGLWIVGQEIIGDKP